MPMTPDEYLNARIDDQVNWYEKKSRFNQQAYKGLRTTEIVLAASIPFLASYIGDVAYVKLATGIAGVVVAVIAGIFALFRFHENWINYRTTGETLKREKFLYLTGAPPYDAPNAFQAFVARCEAAMATESENWKVLFSANQAAAHAPPSADESVPSQTSPG